MYETLILKDPPMVLHDFQRSKRPGIHKNHKEITPVNHMPKKSYNLNTLSENHENGKEEKGMQGVRKFSVF